MNLWVFHIFGRLCQRIVHRILQYIYFSLFLSLSGCSCSCSSSFSVHRVEQLIVRAIYCPPKCSLAGKLRHFIDLTANIAQIGDKRKLEERSKEQKKVQKWKGCSRERRTNRKDFRVTNFWRMWNCVSVQKWLSIYEDYMGIAIHFDTCNATRFCLLVCACACTYVNVSTQTVRACINARLNVCLCACACACILVGGWPCQLGRLNGWFDLILRP